MLKITDLIYLEDCEACKSDTKSASFLSLSKDYEIESCDNIWKYFKCLNCEIIFLNPKPSNNDLKIIYPENYYSYNPNKLNIIAKYGKITLDFLKIRKLIKIENPDEFYYADIGCGDGRYLKILNKYFKIPKKNLYGYDINSNHLINMKNEGYNIISEDFFLKKKNIEAKFDLITMFHVIEHLDNLNSKIKGIYKSLKKEGRFVFETPNHESLDFYLFKKNYWGGYHTPRHWNIFNFKSINILLERNNFQIIDFSFQTGHSFWMWSIHNLLKDKGFKKASTFFNPLLKKSLFFLIAFTIFDKFRSILGIKTSAILVNSKKV